MPPCKVVHHREYPIYVFGELVLLTFDKDSRS